VRAPVPDDLEAVVRVRQAQELADDGATDTKVEALRSEWERLGAQLASDAWVAVGPQGDIIADAQLAQVGETFVVRVAVMPERRGVGIEMRLLELAEARAGEIARATGVGSARLFAQATSNNAAAQRALADAGNDITSTYERMQMPLDAPPTEPPAVAGISVRAIRVGQDEDAVYRADEEAFLDQRGKEPRSFEQWSRRFNLHAEHFDPALWLVAWDEDDRRGEVAGAALAEADGATGWIHHLGVRRPWRGRGLGAALTLHALGALYRRGLRTARLNVDAASLTNAQQLYRRLGFRVLDTYANYEKVITVS
jgi:mycothiol synthase